jgi:hypothetical protein
VKPAVVATVYGAEMDVTGSAEVLVDFLADVFHGEQEQVAELLLTLAEERARLRGLKADAEQPGSNVDDELLEQVASAVDGTRDALVGLLGPARVVIKLAQTDAVQVGQSLLRAAGQRRLASLPDQQDRRWTS